MTVFNVTSRLCLALALTAAIGQAGTALAQNARTIIVGSGKAAVEVDLGVLNRLGPAPNLPRLLSPRPAMTAVTAQPRRRRDAQFARRPALAAGGRAVEHRPAHAGPATADP